MVKKDKNNITNKCIYCNREANSKSDIFPDALTNTKFKTKNVCKIEHNNKFSDEFESAVIEGFSPILNFLDIRSKKTQKRRKCYSTISYKGINFTGKYASASIFKQSVIKNDTGEYLFGPKSKIKGNYINDENGIIHNVNFEYKMDIHFMFELQIKRLSSKIAYEFFCYIYNINYYNEKEFKDIRNFIVGGDIKYCNVEMIEKNELYDVLYSQEHSGYNFIYLNFINNTPFVYVCYLGIIIYRVKIIDFFINKSFNHAIALLPFDGKIYLNKSDKFLKDSLYFDNDENNKRLIMIKDNHEISRLRIMENLDGSEILNLDNETIEILNRCKIMFNEIIITTRLLKEFAFDNNLLNENNISDMLRSSDFFFVCYLKCYYNFYIQNKYDNNIIENTIKEFANKHNVVDKTQIKKIRQVLKNHISYIKKGINILNNY